MFFVPSPQLYQSRWSRFCPSINECWYGHMALAVPLFHINVPSRWGICSPRALCWAGWCKEWTGLALSNELGWRLLIHTYMVFYVQTMYRLVQIVRNKCNLLKFIRTWYVHIRANTFITGQKSPVQRGHIFARFCTYLHVFTCLYVHIRAKFAAKMCKNMTPFEQGGLARREGKSTY